MGETVKEYRFKEKCVYCKGTTLSKFFDALKKNFVAYDPADLHKIAARKCPIS